MIRFENVSYGYKKNSESVLKNVSFAVESGKIAILLGPNGVGKTTLLKCALGLLSHYQGEIYYDDKPLSKMSMGEKARSVAYVPQAVTFAPMTVFNAVLLGRIAYFGLAPRKEDDEATWQTLKELGIEALANRNVEELSGGERQKVAIARAVNQGAKTIIFDEPTSNLDVASELSVCQLVRMLSKTRGITALMSIHDINLALSLGDQFAFLCDGELLSYGGPETVDMETVSKTFGVKAKRVDVGNKTIVIFEGE